MVESRPAAADRPGGSEVVDTHGAQVWMENAPAWELERLIEAIGLLRSAGASLPALEAEELEVAPWLARRAEHRTEAMARANQEHRPHAAAFYELLCLADEITLQTVALRKHITAGTNLVRARRARAESRSRQRAIVLKYQELRSNGVRAKEAEDMVGVNRRRIAEWIKRDAEEARMVSAQSRPPTSRTKTDESESIHEHTGGPPPRDD